MRLRLDERAELAAELLSSLEPKEDAVEMAWATEIVRRAELVRRGEEPSSDWRHVLEKVEKEVLDR